MKFQSLILFLFLPCAVVLGQGHFRLQSAVGAIHVTVNGTPYLIDSTYSLIKTAFPAFDTLTILDPSRHEETAILCNFKADSFYTLIPACCASIDVAPSWKANSDSLRKWDDYERDFEKILALLMDKPRFTLKISNGSANDSIYGWYVDYACFPRFKVLDCKGWEYGVASKCFFWNNISTFAFFKSSMDYSQGLNSAGEVEDTFPDEEMELLGTITVRLFDNEDYVIDYDVETRDIRFKHLR